LGNPAFDKKIIDRRDACQRYHPHLNPPPSRGRKILGKDGFPLSRE